MAANINFSLGYVDFAPKLLVEGSLFKSPTYERFNELMQRANEWLQQHPEVRARTCESIEVKERGSNTVDTDKSTFCESPNVSVAYVRCLRLWILPRTDDKGPPQEIGYFNMAPICIDGGGVFSNPKFESYDATLARINTMFKEHPLPGKILNIETQDMKTRDNGDFKSGKGVDADKCFWSERAKSSTYFLNIIRIFYVKGSPCHEQIGVSDFIPDRTKADGFISSGEFEPFSVVISKAGQWIAHNSSLHISNVQSIDYKLSSYFSGGGLDTMKTSFMERDDVRTYFVRIVRVYFTTSELLTPSYRPLQLTYKTFLPAPVKMGGTFSTMKAEPLSSLMQRVNSWFQHTGAKALSCETVDVRVYSGHQHNP